MITMEARDELQDLFKKVRITTSNINFHLYEMNSLAKDVMRLTGLKDNEAEAYLHLSAALNYIKSHVTVNPSEVTNLKTLELLGCYTDTEELSQHIVAAMNGLLERKSSQTEETQDV